MGKRKVLILDDDQDILAYLKIKLTKADFEVTIANNGEDFFQKISSLNPNICLVDINLNEHQGLGYGIIELIRKKMGSEIKLIAMTRRNSSEDIDRAFKSGANDYINKPVDEVLIINKINSILNDNGQNESAKLPSYRLSASQSECLFEFDLYLYSISEGEIVFCSPNYLAKNSFLKVKGPLIDYILGQELTMNCYIQDTEFHKDKNIYLFHTRVDSQGRDVHSRIRQIILGIHKI